MSKARSWSATRICVGSQRNASGLDRRRQQPFELVPDDRVALASASLETGAVEHRNVPTAVLDQTRVLQVASGFRHAFTAHPKHIGDQFLGHDELVSNQA